MLVFVLARSRDVLAPTLPAVVQSADVFAPVMFVLVRPADAFVVARSVGALMAVCPADMLAAAFAAGPIMPAPIVTVCSRGSSLIIKPFNI